MILLKFEPNTHPGSGSYYAKCDICGFKFRSKELISTYGTRGRLRVCFKDYEDPHPMDYFKPTCREHPIIDKENIRPGNTINTFVSIDNEAELIGGDISNVSGTAPDAPSHLVVLSMSSSQAIIQWQFLGNSGAGGLIGFKIERENPIGGGFSTLISNTGYPSQIYVDNTVNANTQYNYRVSAINSYGTSGVSNSAAGTTATL